MSKSTTTTKRQESIKDMARTVRIWNRKLGLDAYAPMSEIHIAELLDEGGWLKYNYSDSWNFHSYCKAVNALNAEMGY
jgi:hypothetical protein